MRAAAAAILGFLLAGCAPATQTAQLRSPSHLVSPVSQWQDGAGDDLESSGTNAVEDAPAQLTSEVRAALLQAEPHDASGAGAVAGATGEPIEPFGGMAPEVVHAARIEMARAALVEENLNKERVDLAEELQRELAALQAGSQTSKSRVRHGRPTKKQP